jgi:hypothetical protein
MTEIIIISIVLTLIILGWTWGYLVGNRERKSDKMAELIGTGMGIGFNKISALDALTCNRKCIKRRTPDDHRRQRLLEIGYQEYLKREESDKQAIEKVNKEAAESVSSCFATLTPKLIGELLEMGFTENDVKKFSFTKHKGVLYGALPDHKPFKIVDDKIEWIEALPDPQQEGASDEN